MRSKCRELKNTDHRQICESVLVVLYREIDLEACEPYTSASDKEVQIQTHIYMCVFDISPSPDFPRCASSHQFGVDTRNRNSICDNDPFRRTSHRIPHIALRCQIIPPSTKLCRWVATSWNKESSIELSSCTTEWLTYRWKLTL